MPTRRIGPGAVTVAHPPPARQPAAVECLDIRPRRKNGPSVGRGDPPRGGRNLALRHPKFTGSEAGPVELRGIGSHGPISPPSHIIQNRRHGAGQPLRHRRAAAEFGELAVEALLTVADQAHAAL
jgi:hypothetical protein